MTLSVTSQKFKKLLLIIDVISFFAAMIVWFVFRIEEAWFLPLQSNSVWALIISLCAFFYIAGAYDLRRESLIEIASRMIAGWILGLATITFIIYLFRAEISGVLGRGVLLGGSLSFLLVALAVRTYFFKQWKKIEQAWRWFIIAGDAVPSRLVQELDSSKLPGEKLWVTPEAALKMKPDLSSEIVVAGSHASLPKELSGMLLSFRMQGASVWSLPHLFERFWQKVPVFFVQDDWFWASEGFVLAHNEWSLRFKRLIDIGLAAGLLFLVWPIMLLTSLIVKLESPGPSIYKQIRTGRNGKDFVIFKFRSMRLDAEKAGPQWAKSNDDRLLKIGKFIRKTRIDELPQLWNVLSGDMSFIGPRPERPEFNVQLEKEIPYYNLRHLVRPGLTGWAQVNYPYGASVDDAIHKLEYDLFYIKNYNLLLDIQILMKTVRVVLLGKGL